MALNPTRQEPPFAIEQSCYPDVTKPHSNMGTTYHPILQKTASVRDGHSLAKLKALYCNARSIPKHALELWALIDSESPDLFFITETWLRDNTSPDLCIAIPP